MNPSSHILLSGKSRLLIAVASVVLLSCWGISLIQQGGLQAARETAGDTRIELALAAPLAQAAPGTAIGNAQTESSHGLAQAATVLLGLIATGGLTVLAAHAFHDHMHGCGCVSLLAAVGIVALLAALFWWV